MYKIVYDKKAVDQIKNLKEAKLDMKVKSLVEVIKENPYQNLPIYEKLGGDLNGACSRRINVSHRLVYEVYKDEKIVKIISMWSHREF